MRDSFWQTESAMRVLFTTSLSANLRELVVYNFYIYFYVYIFNLSLRFHFMLMKCLTENKTKELNTD